MVGHEVDIEWRGRRASAWVPAPLGERVPTVDAMAATTVRATERAAAAVRLGDARSIGGTEALGRLLLRAEGLASSNIEGLQAPVEVVALAELSRDDASPTAAWVADNLDVVAAALVDPALALTVEVLHGWHERLMRHGTLPAELIGRFRDRQGWIGGTSPVNAVYVPPPADEIPDLVDDLLAFTNGDSTDAVTQAAVVHAQFETIHPYGDGNGRLGRVLIGWVLARRLGLRGAPPPLSVLLARDPGGYLAGLHQYWVGSVEPWVRWFAGVIERSAVATAEMRVRVEDVLAGWEAIVADRRADATARRLLPILAAEPVLHAGLVAERLGVSERAALDALTLLADRGVIEPLVAPTRRQGRPRRWFVARQIVDLVADWP